jgi:hypothetical protein
MKILGMPVCREIDGPTPGTADSALEGCEYRYAGFTTL